MVGVGGLGVDWVEGRSDVVEEGRFVVQKGLRGNGVGLGGMGPVGMGQMAVDSDTRKDGRAMREKGGKWAVGEERRGIDGGKVGMPHCSRMPRGCAASPASCSS